MADAKITELTELATVAGGDLLAIVDDPAGTPITKKITRTNLVSGLAASGDVTASGLTIATDRLAGRDTAATGALEEISVTNGLAFTGSGSVGISNDGVTFARMQNITSDRLIGRDTASSGDPEEISVAGGLRFGGSTNLLGEWDAVVVKGSTESVSSNTSPQNDDELSFTAASGSLYHVELVIAYDSTAGGTTPDLKVDLGEDSSIRGVFTAQGQTTADAAQVVAFLADQTATATFGTGTNTRGIVFTGTYRGNGGTFRFRWAQNTSSGNATRVLAGSLLRYRLIA